MLPSLMCYYEPNLELPDDSLLRGVFSPAEAKTTVTLYNTTVIHLADLLIKDPLGHA
jgi:hypothetical protein